MDESMKPMAFSDAVAEIADVRVFHIRFRISCVRGNILGRVVANYISTHALRAGGEDRDDDSH
jgi:hypothetical protein